jgi:hypothetical protein
MRDPFERLLDRCEWEGDCLVWQGSGPRAYGTFWNGEKREYVHRFVYRTTVGEIPPVHEIDHVAAKGCISKRCINPEHLEPVLHAENRKRARLATCRSGLHDLTNPANVRWDEKGQRRGCRVCWSDRARERRTA